MYPTRTVVFWHEVGGVSVSGLGFVGPGQLQGLGLGAATADVAKVVRAAARRVKKCMVMVMLTMLGEERRLGRSRVGMSMRERVSGPDVCGTSGCWMGVYRKNRYRFIPGRTWAGLLNLGLQDLRAV